jgi:hypothetical protein
MVVISYETIIYSTTGVLVKQFKNDISARRPEGCFMSQNYEEVS